MRPLYQHENILISNKYTIACGDFNIDQSDDSKPSGKILADFITSHLLTRPIHVPTCNSKHSSSILDLFLVSPVVPVSYSSIFDLAVTDHLPIVLECPGRLYTYQVACKTVHRRSYKHFDEPSFNDEVCSTHEAESLQRLQNLAVKSIL